MSTKSSQITGGSGTLPVRRRKQAAGAAEKKNVGDDEFMAAAIGDVEWLKQSLKDSKGIVRYDKHGLAAAHLACIHGRQDCLKFLVEKHKVDLDLPSSTGWRPLHLCISNQTGKRAYQCVAYLLSKGADPSVENDDKVTPVHQASSEGHVQCLKALIEGGAKVDTRDIRGNTPLDLAKLWGHRVCARILASQIWHQGKSFWAQEMRQLEKVRMMQVLQEFAEADQLEMEQEEYGEQAFQEWQASKGVMPEPLKEKKARAVTKKPPIPDDKSSAPSKRGVRSLGGLSHSIESIPELPEPSRHLGATSRASGGTERRGLAGSRPGSLPPPSSRKSRTEKVLHFNPWNKSTHAKAPDYLAQLADVYPRDPFSGLPDRNSAPVALREDFEGLKEVSEKVSRQGTTKGLRMPQLPRDVIAKRLFNDPSLRDRPIVFKCKNMVDVPTKRKYDYETKPRDQVMLHLTDNINSTLLKESVYTPQAPSSSQTSSKSFPVERVAQQLGRYGNRGAFPHFSGETFDIAA